MTNQEAIELLQKYKEESEEDYYVKRAKALDMAIRALEQESTEMIAKEADNVRNSYLAIKTTQRQSCEEEDIATAFQLGLALGLEEKHNEEDCISRQEVLDALDKSKYSNEFCEEHHIDWSINLGMAHIVVNELKSVTPQPEMGRWIRKTVAGYFVWGCNQCGWQQRFATNFCPDCGTRMDESPESEEE